MSRRFSIQILLPIEGYEEDKIYQSEEIALTSVNFIFGYNKKRNSVYFFGGIGVWQEQMIFWK